MPTSQGGFSLSCKKVLEKDSYISGLDFNRSSGDLCAILPSGLQLLNANSLALKCKLDIESSAKVGHLTDVRLTSDCLAVACGPDGHLRLWDTRQAGQAALCMASTNGTADSELKPLLSCDVSPDGRVACAGSEAVKEDSFVLFWDIRDTRQLLGGYWESHSKDVSQVRFHPTKKELLATGGCDGLLNVFDIDEACEDDALLYTLNAECALNHVSWLRANSAGVDRLSVATTEEELQLWTAEDAEPIFRATNRQLAKLGPDEDDDEKLTVNHLIGTLSLSDNGESVGCPVLVSSSRAGLVELWSAETGVHVASLGGQQGGGCGHSDLARFAVANGEAAAASVVLWTAGEDGAICCWKQQQKSTTAAAAVSASDLKVPSSRKANAKIHHQAKPY